MKFKKRVNKAIDALEVQGKVCKAEDGACLYSYEGMHCIVGMMMPDEATCAIADKCCASTIAELVKEKSVPEFTDCFSKKQVKKLAKLQWLHDMNYDMPFATRIRKMRKVIND